MRQRLRVALCFLDNVDDQLLFSYVDELLFNIKRVVVVVVVVEPTTLILVVFSVMWYFILF
jgi:hypothetical protein